ncbi:DUF3592 domain-containing protein [Patescibacteria group bacterium]|nr:DUF3592 domain-containing protein [Patescibacteria group bacterium]MBU1682980.1 DUF3592 domain-containing protein [Patescibacteria group bacterium]
MKTPKAAYIIYFVFTAVGIALIAAGFIFLKNTNDFIKQSTSAPGIVIDMEGYDTYKPIVEFITETGEVITFAGSVSSDPPAYSVGEEVEVLYIPDNPQRAEIKSFLQLWFMPLIMGGIGIIFFGVGFGIFLYRRYRKKLIERLKMSGRVIETEFVRVNVNTNLAINGKHPYNIITQYNENGTVHVFKSENIWYDPTNYVTQKKITVMVDPNSMKKYYMDISFLPEEG